MCARSKIHVFNFMDPPVDCQQLKRTGARSAGCSAACMTSLRLTLWAQHENVGRGLAR